jgi:chemotaxis protein methyltransferase WspC
MSATPDEHLADVFRLLRERAGMAAESMSFQGVAHAVRTRMGASGAESPHAYARRLLSDTAEFQRLLEELVVPETWFFRDELALRYLQRFLDSRRSTSRPAIRLLSVGCSTGEEVYSLAMALREAGLAPADFRILAVDLSRRALELARAGRFPSRSFREPDPTICSLRDRWCERVGESWQVREELLSGVEFRWGNLAQPEFLAGEAPFQVIFCRNVLIYFHAEARRVAVVHLHRLLSPDGFLCSTPAESPIFFEAQFSSLGSECPFAFRRENKLARGSRAAAVARPLQGAASPFPGAEAARLASAHRVADLPEAPSEAPARAVVEAREPTFDANAGDEEVVGQAILKAAQQAADDGRLEAADALCGRALARSPASPEAHYLRGVVCQARGMLREAQRSLEKVLYLAPRHYQALVQMMLLAEHRGDEAAAANFRRRAQRVAAREAEGGDPT